MQFITFAGAVVAMATTVVADRNAISLNQACNLNKPHARIVNRCNYPVYLWSVFKGQGCPTSGMVTLKQGESYAENYLYAGSPDAEADRNTGVSIKISKTQQCKGNDITQLEYFLDDRISTNSDFKLNYLDVSYVDCQSDCPTRKEGYYLQAGTAEAHAERASDTWCPRMSCSNAAECAKMSYVLPDDPQTKTCKLDQSMTFYMCGGNPPSDGDYSAPAKSSQAQYSAAPAPQSSTTLSKAVSSPSPIKVNAAAITSAPEIKEAKVPKVKTNVVYVTKYEYVNAKRHEHAHAHAHARRHQGFQA